jgi:hypothetical protein
MLLLGVCLHSLAAASTLITGASVHDGSGAPARQVAVRIDKDRILAVGALKPLAGEQVIDAARAEVRRVPVVVQAPHLRRAAEAPAVGGEVAGHRSVVEQVARHDGARRRAGGARDVFRTLIRTLNTQRRP